MEKESSLEETVSRLGSQGLSKEGKEELLNILKGFELSAEFGPDGEVLSIRTL